MFLGLFTASLISRIVGEWGDMNYPQIPVDQLRDRLVSVIDSSSQFIPRIHCSHVNDVKRRYKLSQ